ncbi:MAG: NAD(P)/FAD-dependent oxidoreductase [Myxococcota bacterium]
MYDAIIVGARCGGSPLAMLLARQGQRVLLVDKSQFPSDTMSTHYVKRTGAAFLRDWGLLEAVEAAGTPQIKRLNMHFGDFALCGEAPACRGIDRDYTPKRFYLDKILIDAARDAGVEVREEFVVRDLVFEDGRVVGIQGFEKGKEAVEERAKLVVGADGIKSLVARKVGAQTYYDTGSLTCAHYAYFSGIRERDDEAKLYIIEEQRRFIISFPTNDDLDMVFLFWPQEEARRVQGELDVAFNETLDLVPEFAKRVRAGKRETRYRGTHMLPNYFREAHGPGWALIGDAAAHRDPITAQGISNAFTHAHILAEELGAAFKGEKPLPLALASYDRRQLESLKPLFDYTVHLAQLEPLPPVMRQMLTSIADDQPAINAFIGAFIGSVELSEVFPSEMLEGFEQTVQTLAAS